jgi:hypothetical protein
MNENMRKIYRDDTMSPTSREALERSGVDLTRFLGEPIVEEIGEADIPSVDM